MKPLNLIKPVFAATNPAIGTFDTSDLSVPTESTQFGPFVSSVVSIIVALSGIWFLIQLLLAGFGYITGAGDPKKTQEAMKKMTDSIVGIAIVASAFIITAIIGNIFFGIGFNILSPNLRTIQ